MQFDQFSLSLQHGGQTARWYEGTEVRAVAVDENELRLDVFTVIPQEGPWTTRRLHLVPTGARVDGGDLLHSFVRLGRVWHLVLEPE